MATFSYTVYEGTLTTTLTFGLSGNLGGKCWGGYVINDAVTSATTFGVQVSYGASTNFGSTITVKSGERLTLDGLGPVDQIKLVYSTSAEYRIVASNSRSNVQ